MSAPDSPTPSRRTAFLRRFLPVAVSVGILALLFAQLDLAAVAGSLRLDAGLRVFAVILAYVLLSLMLEALSLLRLLRAPGIGLGLAQAARIKAASYLLGTLNYALGAAGLSYLLDRRTGVGIGRAAGVVLLISAFDFGILLGLSSFGIAAYGAEAARLRTPVVVLGIAVGLLAFLLLRSPRHLGPIERLRSLAVFRALAETPSRLLGELLLLRLLFVGGFISMVGLSLRAFDVAVPSGELALGVTLISVAATLPIAAAGIGTSQAAFLYVFREHGDAEVLLACSLTLTAGLILLRGGMGAVFAREYAHEASEALRD